MELILLERVGKLGQIGDIVRVRDGYGRNYLLARGKALRATEANKAKFEAQRADLEARNAKAKDEAATLAAQIDGKSVVLIRQSGETGILYGSVSARDISAALAADGVNVGKGQVQINAPIKTLGLHQVPVVLHAEVSAKVTVNVARSPEEAERQARGEEVLAREENKLDDLGLEIGAALAEAGGDM